MFGVQLNRSSVLICEELLKSVVENDNSNVDGNEKCVSVTYGN